MKKMDMFFFMFLLIQAMENFLTESLRNSLREAECKSLKSKKINRISFYGNLQVIVSQDGTHLGALADLDGTLSAA